MDYDGVSPWHCTECGHDHTGAQWAYICIGCPCPYVPDVDHIEWDDEIDEADLTFECCNCNTPLPDATSDDPTFPLLECGDCRRQRSEVTP